MPSGDFYDLHALPSWTQYEFAAKSLLVALDVDNPEDTVLVQFTISELSLTSLALLVLSRMLPEFQVIAANLSTKIQQVSDAQGFLTGDKP